MISHYNLTCLDDQTRRMVRCAILKGASAPRYQVPIPQPLRLFAAGRDQRIHTLPPYTKAISLDFEDYPFDPLRADHPCALSGATDSYLDEGTSDDSDGRMFVCSDTDYCAGQRGDDAACGREIFGENFLGEEILPEEFFASGKGRADDFAS